MSACCEAAPAARRGLVSSWLVFLSARERAVRPDCLVHHGEGVSGECVLARNGGQQHLVTGMQPAAVPQRGRDRDRYVGPGRHDDRAGRVAAREHHPRVGGQDQPVAAGREAAL
jgi:hypothetical protein